MMPGPVHGMLPNMEAYVGIVCTLEAYRHGVAQPIGLGHVGAPVKGINTVGDDRPGWGSGRLSFRLQCQLLVGRSRNRSRTEYSLRV